MIERHAVHRRRATVRPSGFRVRLSEVGLAVLLAVVTAAVAAGQEATTRYGSLEVEGTGLAGFTLMPPVQTGVAFTNYLPEWRHLTNQILLNGAGVAAGDVDGDGRCDLYLCRSHGTNALFRNLGGWRFESVPEAGGAGCANLTSTGAALADLDGDGDLDLVVNTLGRGTHVFLNNGLGGFAHAPGVLNERRGGMSLALADVDDDGDLDLYITNYRTSGLMDIPNARATFKRVDGRLEIETVIGRPMTDPEVAGRFKLGPRGEVQEQGEPDVLYLNQGGTNFSAVEFTSGAFLDEEGRPLTEPLRDWGLTATFRDLNGDARPDLYVCNDFQTPDRLWIRDGEGHFRLAPPLTQRKTSLFSMAADFADVNRDGHEDFLVLDMMSREHGQRMRYLGETPSDTEFVRGITRRPQYGHNMLFLNRGDGTFAEIAQFAGLEASEWSWSCAFLDVDLDGFDDLLVVNGMERAARDMDVVEHLKGLRARRALSDAEIFQARRMFPRLATPNLAFRNRGDLTFEERGEAWGFDTPGVSSSMALADLDNDGDLDVAVNNLNGAAGLYRNNTPAPRLAVRLRGRAPNTQGVGARLRAIGSQGDLQVREVTAGGRYLAGDDSLRVFGTGTLTNPLRLEVAWRTGARSVVEQARPNQLVEITEPSLAAATPAAVTRPRVPPAPWFQDVSAALQHVHQDPPYDDFARQPLLPNSMSRLGPGVAWLDWDGDGWDDLAIGTGKGGRVAFFRNDRHGGFERAADLDWNAPAVGDLAGLLGWGRAGGRSVLLAAVANYETTMPGDGGVWEFDVGGRASRRLLSSPPESWGPMAMADVDGDGDLELFVGGRVLPGRYPVSVPSRLFRQDGERFIEDTANSRSLEQAGLVSGAVFSDLDGDGDPDLMLACEWGPLRVWRNDGGVLTDQTKALGLDRYTGWWTSVATVDVDEDGRPDLIAGNWGRNTKYQAHRSRPLQVYYADFDGDGITEIIETHYDSALGKVMPERQFQVLARALPFLRERYDSYRAFSRASLEEMLAERLRSTASLSAAWLESTLFLNRGGSFEAVVLPAEAQFAPVFGLGVADFDGDGHEDVFLAQNFFGPNLDTSRYDAGLGVWLQGDGRGRFRAVPPQEAGLAVYGEARGAAVADYDQDGRPDLVVAQNGAETRLFQNQRGTPGLRVRLQGQAANPAGVGATLRLRFDDRWGPAREIQSGAGYGSQTSSSLVMATPEAPLVLWIRWPGGRVTETPLPASARAVVVDGDGRLRSE